jgi:hypothetical protein
MSIRSAIVFAVAACATVCAGGARAQLIDTTDHYRFLPRASVINQQGGFAGVDIDWRVVGTFDFNISPSPLAVFPPIHIGTFRNVDAHGIRNDRNFAVDVNRALNLEGLAGWELRTPGPTTLFRFRGKTGDGSSVELHAALLGPWFYLRGGTTPPAGSADFFEYHIRALARKAPLADFNDDGVVDRGDLIAFTSNFGHGMTGEDFLAWQRQLGETPPTIESMDAAIDAAIAAAGANAAVVPEPGALALIVVAGFGLWARRRR